jgi:Flp pilus assembly secretin CpaC
MSELTDTGAVEIQGFSIPAILTRRAQTTLELKSGQTFAMAGLLNERREARHSRLPILGDLPVLGALFRSVRYTKSETELLVLVTASLVEPLSKAEMPPAPGALEVPENDWEIFLEGSVEGKVHLQNGDPAVLKTLGLKRLKGPGAWASHSKDSHCKKRYQSPEDTQGGGEPGADQSEKTTETNEKE